MLSHVQCWVITILLYLHSIAFQVVLWVQLLLRSLRLYLPSIWWSYNALALFKLAPPWPATEFQCISTQLWEYYWHWRLWLRGQHLVIGIITGSIPVVCMSECPCARYGQRRLQNALNVNWLFSLSNVKKKIIKKRNVKNTLHNFPGILKLLSFFN